ncbi:choice-of-anchor J domain-containing protein [Flavobacterium sp. HSC-61S13]|uniref:choice-of-anchor J domain-containing protein n=1 Tax=Flavobacterium sp. HSC-61S13 TaxID=2910963 RepID=UPI00209C8CED|nr:choice-of-anchor J domain-containing protein [Flavobacterium sp. HSC-61S13]MCP1995102.1 gliding motility-associated-like protein [Flavobacterium sp. HSC-61S13]
MKKITNLFYTSIVLLLIFFGNTLQAGNRGINSNRSLFDWEARSYAPELYLQPYFDLNGRDIAAKALPDPNIVFEDDFEGATSKWTFVNATNNAWYIGSAVNNGGSKSMYISDDKGVSNAYSGATAVSHAISEVIDIPTGSKNYSLSFDWRARGEGTSILYDHLAVWIVPSTFTPAVNVKMTVANSGGILLNDGLNLQDTFKKSLFNLDLSSFAGKKIKIIFQWGNDNSLFNMPPAAVDNVEFVKLDCDSLKNITVTNVTASAATLNWVAPTGVTSMSYEIYKSDFNVIPKYTDNGVLVNNVTTYSFTTLTPAKNYYVWIRTVCSATEKGFWIAAPSVIKTACGVMQVPFWEGFNADSPSLACWKIVDANADSTSPTGNNIWKTSTTNFEGTHSMYFYGSSTAAKVPHDDWMISPPIKFDATKKYRLKYKYRTTTTASNEYEFEVLMSSTGSDKVNKFTQTIVPKAKYEATSTWNEAYAVIGGINADINLAWHVTSSSLSTTVYIDDVSVEELIGCAEPMSLGVKNIGADKATISWTDALGAVDFEYYVQKAGGTKPATGGTATTLKDNIITKDFTGVALGGNTKYEFYVRTICSAGSNSIWQGPIYFTTLCTTFPIPFFEGFNTDTNNIACWTIINNNKDSNTWSTSTVLQEGTHSMYFYGPSSTAPHDDYLVSPTFELDSTKIYKLSYFFRTNASYNNSFEVLVSQNGPNVSGFTRTLTSKIHKSATWEEDMLFIGGVQGPVNIAWRVNTPASTTYLYLDNVRIEEVDCSQPSNLGVKDVEANAATLIWEDNFNKSWEYVIQPKGDGDPVGAGTVNAKDEVTVTKTTKGANLLGNTEYEFYVRSKCTGNKMSDWSGPFVFRTACSILTLPYLEGYEAVSKTKNCWTVLDVNNDGTSTSNMWNEYSGASSAQEGTMSMRFYGTGTDKVHDDWLISPAVNMVATDIYELSYYYRTNSSYVNEFEVSLSVNGLDPTEFKKPLVVKEGYKNGAYEKKTVYITGVVGKAYIGWHVTALATSYVYLDQIAIKKVDCIGPEDPKVTKVDSGSVTFEWEDKVNTNWEYFIQAAGGALPVGSGSLSKTKKVVTSKTNGAGAGNLLPNTEYEYYLRSSCGVGKNSEWIGPFKFRTLCSTQVLPFLEGFNKNSTTWACWTVVDANGDSSSATSNLWHLNTPAFEGDQSARFYGSGSKATLPHNDWLISPTFNFNATKIYRLKYHYRTSSSSSSSYSYEFAVLLSKTGTEISKFTEVVVPKKNYEASNDWKQETTFITSVGGDVNLSWQVTSPSEYSYIYIDNVILEEVTCPEPLNLGVKDEKDSSATIFWSDKFGSNWEYVVQKDGGAIPIAITTGSATKTKETIVAVDKDGKALEQNTEYEFYVRTDCGNGDSSDWSGPFKFRTACGVYKTPFKAGFDTSDQSLICWTIIDGNADAVSPTGTGIWKTSTVKFEGTHSMYFTGAKDKAPHNDWLISPKLNFETGKSYRLKYKYRTAVGTANINEFEVMLSNTGIAPASFTHTVVPKAEYTGSTDWIEEYVFIQGVSGVVNIGWHVTSATTAVNLYIDSVVVEEVKGCFEPLPSVIDSKDYQSNQATLFWDDKSGATNWEYFVQEAGSKYPTKNGTPTVKKENIVTNITSGAALKPNTDYEYYVRTICSVGGYSIWQGPFYFTTTCGVYTTPFWEGFNLSDKSYRCWSVIDANADATGTSTTNRWAMVTTAAGIFEGTHSMYFYGTSGKTHDDWLITPPITLDGGMYVLKYHYKATALNDNKLEVLLSTAGIDPKDFTTTVVTSRTNINANFVEEVAFINGIKGNVNLAWHVPSVGVTNLYVDNVSLKKVENCPEPYYVKLSNETTSSIDVSWTQDGGITSWEVVVMDYKDDATGTPLKTVPVTGAPSTTITGLPSGKGYTIYVRAKCSDNMTSSDWSTAIDGFTLVGTNNNCGGAIVVPINTGLDCSKAVSATFSGAAQSTISEPSCATIPQTTPPTNTSRKDIWFEFTATQATHLFKILDWVSPSGSSYGTVYGALYDVPCTAISSTVASTAVECFTLTSTLSSRAFNNLVPGNKYYIRLGLPATTATTYRDIFKVCINTPSYLEVSPSGTKYTPEELVKDVLVVSNCDLVTNVHYQVGDGSLATKSVNTLGSFTKNGTEFPFKEGIVMSTSEVQFVPGPFTTGAKGTNRNRWVGDKDLNDAINDTGGNPEWDKRMRVTQLEFDFFSIKDSIKFDYLFASNSYIDGCTYTCKNGSLFAAWLIDTTTGEGQNLAKIKGTNTPIALNTIWDTSKAGGTCQSSNPDLFWNQYERAGQSPAGEAPINFAGSTIGMSSETVYVVPGRTYHIKLAVMDFCTNDDHSSAVFFGAASFDLGNLDLGADLLVENGTALCNGEARTINSGLASEDVTIKWFKDDVLLPGEDKPDLVVSESGIYKVVAKYDAIDCDVMGEVRVEIFPPINTVVGAPKAFEICRNSLAPIKVDLTTVEDYMFRISDRTIYNVSYHQELADAESGTNPIGPIYELVTNGEDRKVFILVEDTRTGCKEVFELPFKVLKGELPVKREDLKVCATYTLPALEANQFYYTEAAAQGIQYQAGDVLTEVKTHKIYVLQKNDEAGCYEEISFNVTITAVVKADVFENVELECQLHQLAPLTENNRYFTQSGGQGIELIPGSLVPYAQIIYVYASSVDGLCTDESSFKVSYLDCPIQKGISPNGDGKNDRFDLKEHGVTSMVIYNRYGAEVFAFQGEYTDQWYGQDKSGKGLPDGTYYYVVIAHGKTRTGWVQINK